MKPIVQLIISGNTSTGTLGGTVDLFENEPINLSFSVGSILDFTQVDSNYSQEFTAPGTKNNNILFNNIFEIGSDSTFDPRKKATAYILTDSITSIEGYMQLTNIKVDDQDSITYTIVVFGQVTNLFSKLEGKYIDDLDFSELNHTLNITNIVNTWTGSTASTYSHGYFYPMINYGYPWSMEYWQATGFQVLSGNTVLNSADGSGIEVQQMYPAIYNRYLLGKILSGAGYSFDSTVLNSTAFTESIIPFNGNPDSLLGSEFANNREFLATLTACTQYPSVSGYTWINPTISTNNAQFKFIYKLLNCDDFNSPNFDNGGLYFPGGFSDVYSADTVSIQQFNVDVNWSTPFSATTLGQLRTFHINAEFYRTSYLGGPFFVDSRTYIDPFLNSGISNPAQEITTLTQLNTAYLNQPSNPALKPLQPGENVFCFITTVIESYYSSGLLLQNNTTNSIVMNNRPLKLNVTGSTRWFNNVSSSLVDGSSLNYNNIIPKKILQTDYIKSIVNKFNLVIDSNKNDASNLIIDTRSNYFSSGTTIDWTSKLDEKKPINELLLSEQKFKKYIFKDSDDDDYYNKDYLGKTNQTFGQYIYTFDNEFVTEDQNVESIFAPTASEFLQQTSNIVIPAIYKSDSTNAYIRTDSKPRFLYRKMIAMNPGQYFQFYTGTTHYTSYPYAGHLSDPLNVFPSSLDYDYGTNAYEYYHLTGVTSNNLVNKYWKNYLDGINDKNSKLITAYFYLTPVDIANLDFKNTIQVFGLTDDGYHQFILNSVEYSPTSSDQSCKVELLKLTVYDTTFGQALGLVPGGGINPTQSSRMSMTIGNGQTLGNGSLNIGNNSTVGGKGTISLGSGNLLNGGTDWSTIVGPANTIGAGSQMSFVNGQNNFIDANSSNNAVYGINNFIGSGATNNLIFASNITVSAGTSGSIVLGNSSLSSRTISDSDTTYVSYLNISSGLTLPGGIPFNKFPNGIETPRLSGSTIGDNIYVGATNNITGTSNSNFISNGISNVILDSTSSTIEGGDTNLITGGTNSNISSSKNTTIQGGTYDYIQSSSGSSITSSTGCTIVGDRNSNIQNCQNSIVMAQNGSAASLIINSTASFVLGSFGLNLLTNTTSGGFISSFGGIVSGDTYCVGLAGNQQDIISSQYSSLYSCASSQVKSSFFSTIYSSNSCLIHSGSDSSSIKSSVASSLSGCSNCSLETSNTSFMSGSSHSTINSSIASRIFSGTNCSIIGGSGNSISFATNTSIIGAINLTANTSNSVYVTDLYIQQGRGLLIATGSTNGTVGAASLTLGLATILTTKVTANSIVLLTPQDNNSIGALRVSSRIAGTSFSITSSNLTDSGVVGWVIIEPF